MNYPLRKDLMYMMPTHFGPMCGPRQGPNGHKFKYAQDQRKSLTLSVSFLTNADQLEPLLPPGFSLFGEPVVTVFETFMKEIDWLAGRGYNVLGVNIPVEFRGEQDHAVGAFLLVLWENLTDPILTGREQLGFSKIYCELPEPLTHDGQTHCTASWLGFRFLDIRLQNMQEVPPGDAVGAPVSTPAGAVRGTLHYKYIPKTGEWGQEDVAYAVLTPEVSSSPPPDHAWRGDGSVEFHSARWEDLPTQYMIVNTFAGLEVLESRGATMERRTGGGDLQNQRILR